MQPINFFKPRWAGAQVLNINNPYFIGMVKYPPELQLYIATASENEVPFSDLHLSFSNCFVSTNIYEKRDDFDFDITR